MSLITILLVVTAVGLAVAGLHWFRAKRATKKATLRAAWLNRALERSDSRIEVVEIWSDEQIERHDRQMADAILERVGTDLSADESAEAKRLRIFLGQIRQTDAGGGLDSSRDIGLAWFGCLQILDQDPASDLAQLFKILNDAWSASRDGQPRIDSPDQQTVWRGIAATLVQSRSQS